MMPALALTEGRAAQVKDLLAYANRHPDGFTKPAAAAALDVSLHTMKDLVASLRAVCGETDRWNLICVPNGPSQPFRYRLVNKLDADARTWVDTRIHDAESRIHLTLGIWRSLGRSVDKRTMAGKRVQFTIQQLEHTLAGLALLTDMEAMSA